MATKLPLTAWFLAMFLLTQQKNGVSALELKRHPGVSYLTAWRVKHKLLQVMKERDDRTPLGGVIEVDDADWGGERHGATPGRGSPSKGEFCYRFNRRFKLAAMLPRLGWAAVRTPPMPRRLLKWRRHINNQVFD